METDRYQQSLNELSQREHLRRLEPFGGGVDFASNDYLRLSCNPTIREKLLEFLIENPQLGATGSRHISGNSEFFDESEAFIAKTLGVHSTLFFGSGYLANLGVIGSLGGPDTTFFSDERNHASLIDGFRLAKGHLTIFSHNDMEHLEALLKGSQCKHRVIVTESLFSMDGDQAPLADLCGLAREYGATLVLDEAHATGTLGSQGLGLSHEYSSEHLISIHTCGKALGGYGAFVCCRRSHMREFLINRARSFIFTTAPPPLLIAQARFALDEITSNPIHLRNLHDRIERSQRLFEGIGLPHSGSAILPVIVGSSKRALVLAESLRSQGLLVKAIRYPSVPEGAARLRITLSSAHTDEELQALTWALEKGQLDAPR